LATLWENSAPTLRPLPDHVIVCSTGVWATSWENSAPTLRLLPDHVIVFNWVLGDIVGEFRTNVAAIAGSCDVIGNWGLGESWDNSAPTLRPLPIMDNVICDFVFSSTLILSLIAVVLPYYVALCCGCGYRFSVMMIGLGGVLCVGAYFKKLATR
jgi:hypothetical protein